MKRITILIVLLFISATICNLTVAQQPKAIADAKPTAEATVKMPAAYSTQLTALQERSQALDKRYEQVITLYKEYAPQHDAIQAQAAVLITRAALAAHLTIEQLDNSTLTTDDKGNYQWVPKPKVAASSPPK